MKRKKYFSSIFKDSNLDVYKTIVQRSVMRILKRIPSKEGAKLDLVELADRLANSIVLNIVFGDAITKSSEKIVIKDPNN